MDSTDLSTESRATLITYQDLAQILDYSLFQPELTEEQVLAGCRAAVQHGVASVIVPPSDADIAVRETQGTKVVPASVVGYPYGNSTTPAKLYEGRDLLRRGIRELDMVLNLSKLRARNFQYLESEIMQMAKSCHEAGALLKVVTGDPNLPEDLKVVAVKVAKRAEADFICAASSAPSELSLLQRLSRERIRIKTEAGVDSFNDVLAAYQRGCDRVGSAHAPAILDAWSAHLAALATQSSGTRSETNRSEGSY